MNILSSRTDNGWFVWKNIRKLANCLASIERVLVDARLAREHSFTRFNSGFRAGFLEIIGCIKEVLVRIACTNIYA